MAAEEVIHFSLWAQLSQRPNSPALSPPEPVSGTSSLTENSADICPSPRTLGRSAICLHNQHSEHSSETVFEGRNPKGSVPQEKAVRK